MAVDSDPQSRPHLLDIDRKWSDEGAARRRRPEHGPRVDLAHQGRDGPLGGGTRPGEHQQVEATETGGAGGAQQLIGPGIVDDEHGRARNPPQPRSREHP